MSQSTGNSPEHIDNSHLFGSVAVAIPAYNEADGIEGFLTEIDQALAKGTTRHHIVVVNDRSSDNTLEVLEGLKPKLEGELIVITNEVNSGHGPTVLNAYQRALETGAEWIFQVDGDGQFEGEDVSLLFSYARSGAPIVTGQRITRFDPWYRRVVTTTLPRALQVLFGIKRNDINCPFRLYRSDVLAEILEKVPQDSLTPHVLMTILEEKSAHRCAEIPVRHRPRRGDSEQGTTWRASKILIPKKLLVFLKDSLKQLFQFRKTL